MKNGDRGFFERHKEARKERYRQIEHFQSLIQELAESRIKAKDEIEQMMSSDGEFASEMSIRHCPFLLQLFNETLEEEDKNIQRLSKLFGVTSKGRPVVDSPGGTFIEDTLGNISEGISRLGEHTEGFFLPALGNIAPKMQKFNDDKLENAVDALSKVVGSVDDFTSAFKQEWQKGRDQLSRAKGQWEKDKKEHGLKGPESILEETECFYASHQEASPLTLESLAALMRANCAFVVRKAGGGISQKINDYLPGVDSQYDRGLHNVEEKMKGDGKILGAIMRSRVALHMDHQNRFEQIPERRGSVNKEDCLVLCYGLIQGATLDKFVGQTQNDAQLKTDRRAYYLSIKLNTDLRDGYGRSGGFPELLLVGQDTYIKHAVADLWANPDDINKFIRLLLPIEEFPKINDGILRSLKPAKQVVVLSSDEIPNFSSRERNELEDSIDRAFRENVYVKFGHQRIKDGKGGWKTVSRKK